MIFRQLFEPVTSTYTYLVADPVTREAALIDPVAEEVDAYVRLLDELDLKLVYALETHVHADHVTGGGLLRERLGAKTVVADAGVACADVTVKDRDVIRVGGLALEARLTPGHTDADVVYVMHDRVFTGDTLLIGGCGRTDFQHGDAGKLYDGVHANIFSLPPDTLVYPGHDYQGNTVSTVKQERAKNARLGGGRTREAFIALMEALDLPYPRFIDRALPANQACGMTEAGASQEAGVVDALLRRSEGRAEGYRDLPPEVARDHLRDLEVIDVREPTEFTDDLGHLPGARLVPVARALREGRELRRDGRPLLVVCRSGGRSGQVAAELARQGHRDVYNLEGGMLAWSERRLPVER